MNSMTSGAITLLIWTILIFCLGMYKPKWPLFFMKNPTRFIIMAITLILFMISATLFGEGNRRDKLKAIAEKPAIENAIPAPAPVPVPVPVPLADKVKPAATK